MPPLHSLLTPTTRDDRGTLRPLCRPTHANIQPQPGETLPPLLTDELCGRRNMRWLFPINFAAHAVLIAVIFLIGAPRFLAVMGLLQALLLPSIILLRDYPLPFTSTHFHNRRTAFLAARRCPSCAYPLTTTTPDEHNLTTCPECGASWRIPDPTPA